MNKRGQFFLLAAIAIIAILFGLSTIYSSIKLPPEEFIVYDLSEEINFESGQVIDHGIFNSLTPQEKEYNIENITDYYSGANPDLDIIVIYGDREGMVVVFYTTSTTGSVGINVGNIGSDYDVSERRRYNATIPSEDLTGEETITVIIQQNIRHTFDIKPGQTFFVILQKDRQGERHVAASEPNRLGTV